MTKNEMRPRDFGLLLLSGANSAPRQRARDQQADRAGLKLRRQLLERLIAMDPDDEQLEAALSEVIEQMGPPTGPTRAIAAGVRDEWHLANADPQFIEHLLGEAVGGGDSGMKGNRRDSGVSA